MAIDAEWLEQSGLYKVTDLRDAPDQGDSEDWMAQVLRSAVVGQIPSINVQAMLMRLTRQDVRAGDVIVRQGDIGDYFYIVARGRCAVTRDMPVGSKKLILAELEVGDCFGEEALISGGRRSASVSMLTDGTLMRLGEDDFRKLCCEPLIRSLTLDQARGLAKAGGRWLDVRHPSEITIKSIQGSLAVPLCFLRRRMDGLPRVPLIAVCNTGKSSAVAAFLLAQSGFDVSILEGGLSATTPAVV